MHALSLKIHTSYPYVSHYWKNRQNLLQSRANEPHLVFCGEAAIKTVMSERRASMKAKAKKKV